MRAYVLLLIAFGFAQAVFAQQINWQNKDLAADSVFGISTEKAYKQLLKGKRSTEIIVAIFDSGIDTLQDDLKNVLWTDKDNSCHGWNLIGEETGREDVTNLTGNNKKLYDSLSYFVVPDVYRAGYRRYHKYSPLLEDKINTMRGLVNNLKLTKTILDQIILKIGKSNPCRDDFEKYNPQNDNEEIVVELLLERWSLYLNYNLLVKNEVDDVLHDAQFHIDHGLNITDTEADSGGNNCAIVPDALGLVPQPNLTAYHGTHIAGIIGASRNNGIGLDGVADHVKLMMIKLIGNIRELRDDNLARGIRFAVDHGAKILNLSLGKSYSWDKKAVDEAVKYAMAHDVLIIHAAGNNYENIDKAEHYPNPVYTDHSGTAAAWIEVGASGIKDDVNLATDFSNYGKYTVDVFAPGVAIYSTIPGNKFAAYDGTSAAAPVVSGLAALIREYYPTLSAVQVKDIIMKSVVKRELLAEKCISGGIVNAYNALKLAATYK